MASFGKTSKHALKAFKPWFGLGVAQSENDDNRQRPSFQSSSGDSTTLDGSEPSDSVEVGKRGEYSPTSPSKRFNGWSHTLRSIASLFYIEERDGTDARDPLSNCGQKTPDKGVSRPPLKTLTWSRSSTRSRRSLRRRKHGIVASQAGAESTSPILAFQELPPAIQVDVPHCSLIDNIARDISPASVVRENDHQPPILKDLDDPFITKPALLQADGSMAKSGYSRVLLNGGLSTQPADEKDDKRYTSDFRSDGQMDSPESIAHYTMAPLSKTENPASGPQDGQAMRVRFGVPISPHRDMVKDDLATRRSRTHTDSSDSSDSSPDPAQKASRSNPSSQLPLRRSSSLRKSLEQLHDKIAAVIHPKTRAEVNRSPSCAADSENSDSSPIAPNMGSKTDWDRIRSDRDRRYAQLTTGDPSTESDDASDGSLQLSRSPSRRPENTVQATSVVGLGVADPVRRFFTGDLCYSVEANERLSALELEDEELNPKLYHAIGDSKRDSGISVHGDRLSGPHDSSSDDTENSKAERGVEQHHHASPATTQSHQAWLLLGFDPASGLDSQDPYEAGLRAAGIHKHTPHQSPAIPTSHEIHEAAAQNSFLLGAESTMPQVSSSSSVANDHKQPYPPHSPQTSVLPLQECGHVVSMKQVRSNDDDPPPYQQRDELRSGLSLSTGDNKTTITSEPLPDIQALPVQPHLHVETPELYRSSATSAQTLKMQRFLVQPFKEPDSLHLDGRRPIITEDGSHHSQSAVDRPPSSSPISPSNAKEGDALSSACLQNKDGEISPSARQRTGLIRHLEEREAKALMQLVYNLEEEEETERAASESELSGTGTISID